MNPIKKLSDHKLAFALDSRITNYRENKNIFIQICFQNTKGCWISIKRSTKTHLIRIYQHSTHNTHMIKLSNTWTTPYQKKIFIPSQKVKHQNKPKHHATGSSWGITKASCKKMKSKITSKAFMTPNWKMFVIFRSAPNFKINVNIWRRNGSRMGSLIKYEWWWE